MISPRHDEYLDMAERLEATYRDAGHAPRETCVDTLGAGLWLGTYVERYQAGGHEPAVRSVLNQIADIEGRPRPYPAPPVPTIGRLRVDRGRLFDVVGQRWIGWHGISEFALIYLAHAGREGEAIRRLDRAAGAGRNGVRVLGMARHLFDLRPSMPGYWASVERVVQLARDRGLYVELCWFADAQDVMPERADRHRFAQAVAAFCHAHPTVIGQVANEPFKNGWASATDPALFAVANILREGAPETLWSLGDPVDVVDDPTTGQPLRGALEELAERSDILVLHGERKRRDDRFAGWVDHLKGFDEVYENPRQRARWHDEPMGAASAYQDGRRDHRPTAHLAASLTCAVLGMGFTYHYISEQDDAVPGLSLCAAAALVPQAPDFRFRNAGTGGACVTSFAGYDKVRTCDNGREAWAVAYGQNRESEIRTAEGWRVADVALDVRDADGRVTLYRLTREG